MSYKARLQQTVATVRNHNATVQARMRISQEAEAQARFRTLKTEWQRVCAGRLGAEDAEQDTELALQRSLLLERNSDRHPVRGVDSDLGSGDAVAASVRPGSGGSTQQAGGSTITWRTQSRGCSMAGEGAAAGAPAARTAGAR